MDETEDTAEDVPEDEPEDEDEDEAEESETGFDVDDFGRPLFATEHVVNDKAKKETTGDFGWNSSAFLAAAGRPRFGFCSIFTDFAWFGIFIIFSITATPIICLHK